VTSLCAWIIARDEARDLPRCIASIRDVADHIILVDTGSTDETPAIARELGCEVHTYLDASEHVDGKWRITDFSKARNHAIALAEAKGCTWWAWFDADDELMHPQSIRRAMYLEAFDCYAAWIQDGGSRWIHHRIMRSDKRVRFAGAVHEYPIIDGLRQFTLDDCTIRHHSAPAAGQENSNARNLRLLLSEYERNPSARTTFYLANTYKDAGRWSEAVQWYEKRIAMGPAHRDEWLFARLYGARCARLGGDIETAETLLEGALSAEDAWAEFHVELAFCAYARGQYEKAISIAIPVRYPALMQIPVTHLWREPTMYRDQPLRLISWCYEHLGRLKPALAYANAAAREIEGDDLEWNARIARLQSLIEAPARGPAVIGTKVKAIALCRPGAIGDILMTLNLIPALREANPGTPIHYFCDAKLGAPDALGKFVQQAGVDVVMDSARWSSWQGKYERAISLVGYPLADGYPDKPMAMHLLDYFGKEMGLMPQSGLPALTLRRPGMDGPRGADYATLQTKAGWSKYKQWRHWDKVIAALPHIPFVHIGEGHGLTLSQSIGIIANARIHVGIDSFANHLTNYFWLDGNRARKVLGVIVWGSTQASAAGYPDNINLSAELHCQPCFRENPAISRMDRGPCINPPRPSYDDDTPTACSEAISVDQVVEAVREMWERAK
jgi:tetratricopeptide (TPR) repeat protein